MMIIRDWIGENWAPALIYCFFSVGLIGHIVGQTHDFMMDLTPIFLLLMGIAVLLPIFAGKLWKTISWLAVIYLITLAIEIIGVKTGLIFGAYDYGETLGLGLMGVPLVIGFNWTLIIIGSVSISNRVVKNRYLSAVVAGSMATFFDIILEPVAIELDYWAWDGGAIPLQNYIAWFLIGTVFALTYNLLSLKARSRLLIHYFFVQTLFFLFLRLDMAV
ncbi:MAG: carotenoid biosynthesis protein [Thermoplasmatota archaeon]